MLFWLSEGESDKPVALERQDREDGAYQPNPPTRIDVVRDSKQAAILYTTETGPSERDPVACRDGDGEVIYLETIPEGTRQEEMSDCLRFAVSVGEVAALKGRFVEGGLLIDVGVGSILWRFDPLEVTTIDIHAYAHRIVIADHCDEKYELAAGVLTQTSSGSWCGGIRRIEKSDLSVSRPDFTIFVVGRQFVADGEDGWYHMDFAWPHIELTKRGSGIWITAEQDYPGAAGGVIYGILRPLAGDTSQLQEYYVSDWIGRVYHSLIPQSFDYVFHQHPEGADGRWTMIREWVDAMMNDLFHDRENPLRLELEAVDYGLIYADTEEFFTTEPFASAILYRLAWHFSAEAGGESAKLAGTMLMLWERYVPSFNHTKAVALADRYLVQIGEPVPVNPVSGRTTVAREVLKRKPPEARSDYEPISPAQSHLSVVLRVGQSYERGVVVVSSKIEPGCGAQYRSDGSFVGWQINPSGEFTVQIAGFWNGLELSGFSNTYDGEGGMMVKGTPTVAGRVRVKVLSFCDVADGEEPIFLGYSEIIVVDPNDE